MVVIKPDIGLDRDSRDGCARAGCENKLNRGWPREATSASSACSRMGSVVWECGGSTQDVRAARPAIGARPPVSAPALSRPTNAAHLAFQVVEKFRLLCVQRLVQSCQGRLREPTVALVWIHGIGNSPTAFTSRQGRCEIANDMLLIHVDTEEVLAVPPARRR